MDCQKQYITFVPTDLSKEINKYELNMEESLRRMMDRHMKSTTTPFTWKELMNANQPKNIHVTNNLLAIMSCGILRYQDQQCNQYHLTVPTSPNVNKFIYIYEIVPNISYYYYDLYLKFSKTPWIVVEIEYRANNDNDNDNNTNNNNNIHWWGSVSYCSLQGLFTGMVRWHMCKTMLSLYSRFEHKRRELKKHINWLLVEDEHYVPVACKSHADGQFLILNPFSKDHDLDAHNVFKPSQFVTNQEYVVDLSKPLHPRTSVYACRIVSQL